MKSVDCLKMNTIHMEEMEQGVSLAIIVGGGVVA